jgi:hypothetical protein
VKHIILPLDIAKVNEQATRADQSKQSWPTLGDVDHRCPEIARDRHPAYDGIADNCDRLKMKRLGPPAEFEQSPIVWFCLLACCAGSPFLFVILQSYVARLIVPTLQALGVTSATELYLVVLGMNVLGALITAAILCIPLGWLARRHPAVLGAIVGLVGGLALSWIWRSLPSDGVVSWVPRIVEVGAFIGGCILFAIVGARGTHRVAA